MCYLGFEVFETLVQKFQRLLLPSFPRPESRVVIARWISEVFSPHFKWSEQSLNFSLRLINAKFSKSLAAKNLYSRPFPPVKMLLIGG